MIRAVVLIILMVNTSIAFADSVYLHLPVTEHYAGVEYETENNWGIGWQSEDPVLWDLKPMAGVYYNSNRHTSVYAGGYDWLYQKGEFSMGYGILAVTGYYDYGPVIPSGVLLIQYGKFRANIIPGAVNLSLTLFEF